MYNICRIGAIFDGLFTLCKYSEQSGSFRDSIIMKKLSIKSFALAFLCALAVVACDKNYDINGGSGNGSGNGQGTGTGGGKEEGGGGGGGVDPSIEILPDVSIKVGKKVTLKVGDLVPDDIERIYNVDGYYFVQCHNEGEPTQVMTPKEFAESGKVAIPAEFTIPTRFLPHEINGDLYLHCPIFFDVKNPSGEEMMLSAKITCGSKTIDVSDVNVPAGDSRVTLDDEEIIKLFRPFSKEIAITDVVLTRIPSENPGVETAAADDLEFYVYPNVPVQFCGSDTINFTYSGLFKEAGLYDLMKNKVKAEAKNLEIKLTVSNSVPFDFSIASASGSKGTVSISPAIKAGIGKAETTETVLTAKFDDGVLNSINNVTLAVKAAGSAERSDLWVLQKDMMVEITIESMTIKK